MVLVAVQGMMRGGNVAIVTLSLALGSVIGLGIDIDARIRSLGDWAQRRLNQAFAGSKRLGNLVGSFLTDAVVTEVAITGSTLLLAVGTNLLGVTDIRVANLIPAAFAPILLVPVATALGLM